MNPVGPSFIILLAFLCARVSAQYDQCTGIASSIASGLCEDYNNNAECGYDGGDCCYCSCVDGPQHTCGADGFDCRDPEYVGEEILDCTGGFVADAPCSTNNASQQWVVNNTASATALADAILCSVGSISVEWIGHVVVNRTMRATNGASLHVTGVGPGAEMQAAPFTRLFAVINASLDIRNLSLAGGRATFGGAIAAASSNLSLENTSLTGNAALVEGGALYATSASTVSCGKGVLFDGNHAHDRGGALSVGSASSATFLDASFTNNTTDGLGGALDARDSSVSWVGDASFADNAANDSGGALQARGSTVSWAGDVIFTSNIAKEWGGALSVESSNISWVGDALFINNSADVCGGAMFAYLSNVSWADDALYSGNIADELGGALFVHSSDVSWTGDASFTNNIAGEAGGAMYIYDSNIHWVDDASFASNIANDKGGAVCVVSSTVFWSGNVSFSSNIGNSSAGALLVDSSGVFLQGHALFTNNTAEGEGGALYTELSSIYWAGDALFSDNIAAFGGALSVYASDAFWAGDASFSSNTAYYIGGAVEALFATVSWAGDAVFSNNNAVVFHGGALFAMFSHASYAGDAFFHDNTASEMGGALHAGASTLSWAGDAFFSNNIAGKMGGAVSNGNSNISWGGEASFVENSARRHGGALYITAGSRVFLESDAVILGNSASGDGGAVYIYSADYGEQVAYLYVYHTATFLMNLCGGNGGALAIIAAGSVVFATENVTFSRNSAHTAGGAVSVNGVRAGPQFTGLSFVSNRAQIGGAAHVTGSGTATTEDRLGVLRQNPTTFDGCKFIGNIAEATGGAVDTGAGFDTIVDTYFVGNSAKAGGALRLAGVTSFHNCTFTENTSDDGEGPAISNAGSVLSTTACSFADNIFKCKTTKFLDFDETSRPDDAFDVVCKGCDSECYDCSISSRIPACAEELEHTQSAGGNATVEALEIEPGYWRATNTSKKILVCFNGDACLGGVTGASGYCGAGYEGPYCSICLEGYSPDIGQTCSRCSGGVGFVFRAWIVVIPGILAVILLLCSLIPDTSTRTIGTSRGLLSLLVSWRRRLLSLKIVVIVWQIITQFAAVTNAMYGGVYREFLDKIDVLNLDLSRIPSMACIINLDFHRRLLVSTLGPPAALIVLGAMYIMSGWRLRASRPRGPTLAASEKTLLQKYLSVALLVTFLMYSSVSANLFRMFACDELDDGKSYLRVDYRIDCNSPTHRSLQVYAIFMMLVYTVGIPAGYSVLLFRNKKVLMDASAREDDAATRSFSSLWELYKPDRFYYELIECGRRILLAGVIVFIYPNTTAQVAVAVMIAASFMILSEMLAPYESVSDAWLSRIGHSIVFGSMYLALLLKIDVSNEREESQRIFEVTLVAAHACMFLLVMSGCVIVTYRWIKGRNG